MSHLKIRTQVLQGHIKSAMRFNWETIYIEGQKRTNSNIPKKQSERWNYMLRNTNTKDGFSQALMQATLFTPPLYVGKADNLAERYRQHVYIDQDSKNSFHFRFSRFCKKNAVRLSVSDLLFVCIKTTSKSNLVLKDDEGLEENEKLNELLEFIMMRMSRPPFSMR